MFVGLLVDAKEVVQCLLHAGLGEVDLSLGVPKRQRAILNSGASIPDSESQKQ